MQSQLNPYLSFKGNARQAMEFYKSVFGGKLEVHTFKEFDSSSNPSEDNLIMHSMLEADNGITFMASDTPSGMEYSPGTNITMSLSGDNEEELRGYWKELSAEGTVTLPLEQAPWGDTFGIVMDKFNVQWMVNIASTK